MLGCLGREVSAVVSVADCVVPAVDYEARPMEDAEGVVGMLLAVETSRTRRSGPASGWIRWNV
jgi:hypothetical protein